MKTDDLIKLKQLFIPTPTSNRGYQYAVIVDLIRTNENSAFSSGIEILAHLCEGDRTSIYTDEFGSDPIYSFYLDEVEPVEES
ncbi:MAG: hypothetical protein AAGA75_22225 [Cyanobacteria bacterium P01_E01_bin.6]